MKTLVASLGFFIVAVCAWGADQGGAVVLNWLNGAAPTHPTNVSWGTPWPVGAIQKSDTFTFKSADGQSLPLQTWPLAYWPDGSIKWSGHAVVAPAGAAGPFHLSHDAGPGVPADALHCSDTTEAIEID